MTVSRLFTGTGDQGTTDLLGARVGKDDPRIDAIGTLDEATSAMGLARALALSDQTKTLLIDAQRDLYKIMAELAFRDDLRPAAYVIGADRVVWLETETDRLTATLNLPPEFILPGDSAGGSALDVARATVRRAERSAVHLVGASLLTNAEVLRYLNRLSSLLFVLARFEDGQAGAAPLRAKTPASR